MKKNKQKKVPKFKIEGEVTTNYGHANIGNTYKDRVDLSCGTESKLTENQIHREQEEPQISQFFNQKQTSGLVKREREQKSDVKLENHELEITSKLEKNLIIKREEPIIKIGGSISENAIIGNTFTGNTNFSHNQIINHHTKNIQGFNIEGSNNTLTNPSVHDNTLETITYEEETELQPSIEYPPPNKLLK